MFFRALAHPPPLPNPFFSTVMLCAPISHPFPPYRDGALFANLSVVVTIWDLVYGPRDFQKV